MNKNETFFAIKAPLMASGKYKTRDMDWKEKVRKR